MSGEEKVRILVVDDEDDVLNYLATLLEDAGFAVERAKDGAQALAAVRRRPPHLVSLDISMPERSGVRFYRDLKEDPALKSIPVVIVTGITNPWEGPEGQGSFGDFLSKRKQVPPPEGYFEKPVDPEAYLAAVRRLAG